MNWQVELGNGRKLNIRLPQYVPTSVPFRVSIEGKEELAHWFPEHGYLQLGNRNLRVRRLAVQQPPGESEANVEVELHTQPTQQPARLEALVSAVVPGMEHRQANAASQGRVVRSPMTGKVLSVGTENGASVDKGQEILVIEAMKMENKIYAPVAGSVEGLKVKPGDSVSTNQELLKIKA